MLADELGRNERGSTVLLYLLAAAAALGALWWLYATIDGRGHARGVAETEKDYAKRDNEALRTAIATRDRLQREKDALEAKNAQLVTAASANYQKGLTDGKAELDAALARARGGQRLRDAGARCPAVGDRDATGAARAGAGGRDGPQGADLSDAAAEFLLRLAGEADDVVRQLAACQAVVRADRE